jgi:hypothetical protein
MTKTCYAHFDARTRLFFYYNAADGTRCWQYPEDGRVSEATTLRPVCPPGSPLRWEEGDDSEAELLSGIEIDPATGLPVELRAQKAAPPRPSSSREREPPPPPPPASDPEPEPHSEEEAASPRPQPKGAGRGKGAKAAARATSGRKFPPVQQLLMGTISDFTKGRSFADYAAAMFRGRKGGADVARCCRRLQTRIW